jgi:hypothetical protein
VTADGSRSDAGLLGDLVEWRVDADLREQRPCGVKHPRAVPCRVGAQRLSISREGVSGQAGRTPRIVLEDKRGARPR